MSPMRGGSPCASASAKEVESTWQSTKLARSVSAASIQASALPSLGELSMSSWPTSESDRVAPIHERAGASAPAQGSSSQPATPPQGGGRLDAGSDRNLFHAQSLYLLPTAYVLPPKHLPYSYDDLLLIVSRIWHTLCSFFVLVFFFVLRFGSSFYVPLSSLFLYSFSLTLAHSLSFLLTPLTVLVVILLGSLPYQG